MYAFQHGIIASSNGGAVVSTDFIMTIDTTKTGSASDTFILKAGNTGTYNATIDWGDGNTSNITSFGDADLTHVYVSSGTYQISISGDFPWIWFNDSGDKLKVISIDSWGNIGWKSFDNSFKGCSNLSVLATDTPDLSNLNYLGGGRLFGMFESSGINGISNFKNWDTSTIITSFSMFKNCLNLVNLDMSSMNFSNAINFSGLNAGMFISCANLGSVNVTGITLPTASTNAQDMFKNCGVFDLIGADTWNIENITNLSNFLQSSTITTTEYDKLLIAWDSQDAVNGLSVNFGSSQYTLASASATARAGLIANDLWTITDGGGI